MATGGLYGNSGTGALIAQPGTESAGLYGKSPNGSVVAQPGSESAGLYGNGTTFGGSYFEWFVFQTSATQPATPTGGSWSFQTNSGTPPSGWTNAPASNPTNPVWISIALVNSKSTSSLVWSTPGVLSYSGTINGSSAPTSGVGQIGELYIQTGVTPNALWFKTNSTTWTQITGSALYVDLVSSQTIAGTKTFSSTIQGSISGNAGTVTNGVYTNGTYVNPSWIASLAGSKITGDISGNAANVTGTVAVVNGGTGSTTASGARTNLGLGTISTQDASSVAITGGSITGITDLAIADGGTGASTAGQARINLGLGTSAVLDAGVANGVATLDSGGTVPLSQIPASLQGGVSYQGAWNASTNSPTLTSSVGTKGYYYVVSVAGSTNLNGVTDWNVGDWAIFNGTVWQKIDNTDAVTSVNGYTGTVVLNAADVGALSTLTSTDGSVTITSPNSVTRDLSVAISGSTTNVLCLVRNTTGATLAKGTVVYISGATGQNPTVSKALATSDATSAQTLGMMTADLANNSNGYVTVIGLITNIDTSAYTDGQQLYLSGTTAGAVTGTKPYAPIHLVYVAVVEYAHPTQGKLFVKVQNGYELDEIHNVSAQSPSNGQTIVYNSATQLWEKSFAPIISGTTIDNTAIGATTPSTGVFTTLTATGQTSLGGAAGAEAFRAVTTASAVNRIEATGGITGGTNFPRIVSEGSDSSAWLNLSSKGSAGLRFWTNASTASSGNEQARVSHTASAVNYVQVTGAATTNRPAITTQGSDNNISLNITSKGGSSVYFNTGAGTSLEATSTGTAVNYLTATGVATTLAPSLKVNGSDTNISQVFQSKGTGAIDLAAGSSGVNISNGGTVTAITRTATSGGYTSAPTIAISAPTTAGGVQATVTGYIWINTVTLSSGGTGYTVGDVLSIAGGSYVTNPVRITVTGVSAGVITSFTFVSFDLYNTAPSNPASVTGGTGSGATFTLNFSNSSTFTITNAGSGYVEQPTVTFSGGGGSGAAAYATVGSATTVRSLGSTVQFATPAGIQAQISDSGSATPTAYPNLNGSTFNLAYLTAVGSAGNAGLVLASKGTSAVDIYTNSTGSRAASFSHTASAVNYVQVTGGATTVDAKISAQGSDASIGMSYSSKNGYFHRFWTNNFADQQFAVLHTASSANYATAKGSATGFGVVFSAAGTDNDIPVVVQPKGTGALQAQQTDSTATGGNARGANAVDWQTSRGAANQVASSTYTVVSGGSSNRAAAYGSALVGGIANNSLGGYSFAGAGLENYSQASYTVAAGGFRNNASGVYNFIGGGYTNSGTANGPVTTQSATMNGTTAVTLSGSNAAIKVGQAVYGTYMSGYPNDTYVAAISGTSLTLSQVATGSGVATLSFYTPHGVVVGGGNNQATGAYSFIGGGGDAGTAANRNTASGAWSAVVGGTRHTASGNGSFVGGGGTDGSGSYFGNTASGDISVIVGGSNHTASGTGSMILGGFGNQATGSYSSVFGGTGNLANATQSSATGNNATTRSIIGQLSIAPCNSPISGNSGVSQTALIVLAVQTTDATATVLRSNTSAAGTTNQVILPNNSAYYFRGSVIANVTGAANGAAWDFTGAIMRGANAASTVLIGTPAINRVAASSGATAWTIAITADTTNGGLAVTVTGAAATTIRWVCKAETTEVTF